MPPDLQGIAPNRAESRWEGLQTGAEREKGFVTSRSGAVYSCSMETFVEYVDEYVGSAVAAWAPGIEWEDRHARRLRERPCGF